MVDPARARQLGELAEQWGIAVDDAALFDRALTHASRVAEDADVRYDYESLEFLGDAVLGLAAAHYLFERYPDRTPGEYTRMRAAMVNRACVARVAEQLNIAPVIRLGRGEERSGGRKRKALLADCLEAFIGAIYLDSGWEVAQRFVRQVFKEELDKAQVTSGIWDFKSRLQNLCQAEGQPLPRFEVVRSEGPDHNKAFEVEVWIGDKSSGRGRGSSKKKAEQDAARAALEEAGHTLD